MDFFIVTPSFNQKKFLQQTIDSVLGQQATGEVNYWVFDGGSTDGSKELLKKYDKKISWQSKKDKGQTDALNKGVKELKNWLNITGKDPKEVVFAYLNSDDYYLTETFLTVAKAFKRYPQKKWLVGDCLIVDEAGSETQTAVRWYKKIWRNFLTLNLLGVLNPIPQPAVFFRAEAILALGEYDEQLRFTMDYEYWLKSWQLLGKPILTNKALASFRIHSQSKSGSEFKQQFDEQFMVAEKTFPNSFLLVFHQLHNYLIKFVYSQLKRNL